MFLAEASPRRRHFRSSVAISAPGIAMAGAPTIGTDRLAVNLAQVWLAPTLRFHSALRCHRDVAARSLKPMQVRDLVRSVEIIRRGHFNRRNSCKRKQDSVRVGEKIGHGQPVSRPTKI